MSVYAVYLVGFALVLLGLGVAAYLLGVPPAWIAGGVVSIAGIALLIASNRPKPPNTRSS